MMHRYQRLALVLLTMVAITFGWFHGLIRVAEANVNLTLFDVLRGANATDLNVTWVTESETDMVGFRVKRATSNDVQTANTVMTVQAQGTAATGASYSRTDPGLVTGQTYYYWLYEIKSDGTENLLTPSPESEAPGAADSPTSTPTFTATTVPTQPSTSTPTATVAATVRPTNTPTSPAQVANPTSTPTTAPAQPTATFTVPPQATNTPVGQVSTPLPTNTPIPPQPDQPTSTPAVVVPTAIVEGNTPAAELAPDVKTEGNVQAIDATPVTDQALQVPSAPTAAPDATAEDAAVAAAPASSPEATATAQAIAEEPASDSGQATESLARPTATPRPDSEQESDSNSSSLLLIFGGASLCGAVVLALAAIVVWRRR